METLGEVIRALYHQTHQFHTDRIPCLWPTGVAAVLTTGACERHRRCEVVLTNPLFKAEFKGLCDPAISGSNCCKIILTETLFMPSLR